MTKRQWHSGPPPSVGWWPASTSENAKSIRWWDGEAWSRCALQKDSATEAAFWAGKRDNPEIQAQIEWTERWWE